MDGYELQGVWLIDNLVPTASHEPLKTSIFSVIIG